MICRLWDHIIHITWKKPHSHILELNMFKLFDRWPVVVYIRTYFGNSMQTLFTKFILCFSINFNWFSFFGTLARNTENK